MPSFDVVSEVDIHEVTNAVDQANREVSNRFDFKGSDSKFEFKDNSTILLQTQNDFQLKQMLDILYSRFAKRNIDIGCIDAKEPVLANNRANQTLSLKQGIETDIAKKIVKFIKDKKLKVQAAIQGEQIRVTGKNRDDLQEVISQLRDASFNLPLQFNNFRD